jgi:hypothetical protein
MITNFLSSNKTLSCYANDTLSVNKGKFITMNEAFLFSYAFDNTFANNLEYKLQSENPPTPPVLQMDAKTKKMTVKFLRHPSANINQKAVCYYTLKNPIIPTFLPVFPIYQGCIAYDGDQIDIFGLKEIKKFAAWTLPTAPYGPPELYDDVPFLVSIHLYK